MFHRGKALRSWSSSISLSLVSHSLMPKLLKRNINQQRLWVRLQTNITRTRVMSKRLLKMSRWVLQFFSPSTIYFRRDQRVFLVGSVVSIPIEKETFVDSCHFGSSFVLRTFLLTSPLSLLTFLFLPNRSRRSTLQPWPMDFNKPSLESPKLKTKRLQELKTELNVKLQSLSNWKRQNVILFESSSSSSSSNQTILCKNKIFINIPNYHYIKTLWT